ncbi:coat protein [Grapevine foveavirus A]|uniref:Capsid protein n=1 Tax=Grapevine foveavirus A TaxID=2763538 RepID=A0A7D5B0P6_9VIRU|nr:coat protein [Grapevine foveavirus A]QKV50513.1 coat protein [Grapevine foveavirus A]
MSMVEEQREAEEQRQRKDRDSTGKVKEVGEGSNPVIPDLSSVIKRKKKPIENALSAKVNISDLMKLEFGLQSNNVMNNNDILAISSIFTEAKIPENQQQHTAIEVARMAVDVGSSKHSEFVGKSAVCGQDLSVIVGYIKEVTTLRRFCMYYSKIIWNLLIKEKTPPANWAKKGFKDETKFAAFDFFIGIFDESSLEPDGGLIRSPTQRELRANIASFEVKVFRQSISEGNRSLNLGEISGGAMGAPAYNPFGGDT